MDSDKLRKVLAGISIVSLMAGASVIAGCGEKSGTSG